MSLRSGPGMIRFLAPRIFFAKGRLSVAAVALVVFVALALAQQHNSHTHQRPHYEGANEFYDRRVGLTKFF